MRGWEAISGRRVVPAEQEEEQAAGSQTKDLGQKSGPQGELAQKSADQVAEGSAHALDGGQNGEIAAPLHIGGGVDHIDQAGHRSAADEKAGNAPGGDDQPFGVGQEEEQLAAGITAAADEQGHAAGDIAGQLAPEGGKEEVCGLHGGKGHAKHIIAEMVNLDEGGGHRVGEIGRQVIEDEHQKEKDHRRWG